MMGTDPETTRDRLQGGLVAILRLLPGETVTEQTDWSTMRERAAAATGRSSPRTPLDDP